MKFTAASSPVRYHFAPLLLLHSLFVHSAVVKINNLAVGGSVSRAALGVIPPQRWTDKGRRVTVHRQVAQQIDIYSLNGPKPSPLPPQWPLHTIPAPITVLLTSPAYTSSLYTIFPSCPADHYKQHGKTCTNTVLLFLFCPLLYVIIRKKTEHLISEHSHAQRDIVAVALTCPRD